MLLGGGTNQYPWKAYQRVVMAFDADLAVPRQWLTTVGLGVMSAMAVVPKCTTRHRKNKRFGPGADFFYEAAGFKFELSLMKKKSCLTCTTRVNKECTPVLVRAVTDALP